MFLCSLRWFHTLSYSFPVIKPLSPHQVLWKVLGVSSLLIFQLVLLWVCGCVALYCQALRVCTVHVNHRDAGLEAQHRPQECMRWVAAQQL